MSDRVSIRIKRLKHAEGLELPDYRTSGSAGMDLRAAVDTPIVLQPGERALVPTGLSMAIPEGYEAQVRPRSGLALESGITCLNTPGTIDADYRGEVGVVLINHGTEAFRVERGDRIAQLVVAAVLQVRPVEVSTLDGTDRGADGFGSSGTS